MAVLMAGGSGAVIIQRWSLQGNIRLVSFICIRLIRHVVCRPFGAKLSQCNNSIDHLVIHLVTLTSEDSSRF